MWNEGRLGPPPDPPPPPPDDQPPRDTQYSPARLRAAARCGAAPTAWPENFGSSIAGGWSIPGGWPVSVDWSLPVDWSISDARSIPGAGSISGHRSIWGPSTPAKPASLWAGRRLPALPPRWPSKAQSLPWPPLQVSPLPPPLLRAPRPELATPEPELATPAPKLATPGPELATPAPKLAAPEPELMTPAPELATPESELALLPPPLRWRCGELCCDKCGAPGRRGGKRAGERGGADGGSVSIVAAEPQYFASMAETTARPYKPSTTSTRCCLSDSQVKSP
mmetsp:Transcript_2532/g.8493  ORF Transcript_2532/g.8493 Transcript_2532/m.8493 type:complete len:281 (-) Transcript_2532:2072-2914(-)